MNTQPQIDWFLPEKVRQELFNHLVDRVEYPEEVEGLIEVLDVFCVQYMAAENADKATLLAHEPIKRALRVLINALHNPQTEEYSLPVPIYVPLEIESELISWRNSIESAEVLLEKARGPKNKGAPKKENQKRLIRLLWSSYPEKFRKKTRDGDFDEFATLILRTVVPKDKFPDSLHDVIIDALDGWR